MYHQAFSYNKLSYKEKAIEKETHFLVNILVAIQAHFCIIVHVPYIHILAQPNTWKLLYVLKQKCILITTKILIQSF